MNRPVLGALLLALASPSLAATPVSDEASAIFADGAVRERGSAVAQAAIDRAVAPAAEPGAGVDGARPLVIGPQLEVQVHQMARVGRVAADGAERVAGGDDLAERDGEAGEVRVVAGPPVGVADRDGAAARRVARLGHQAGPDGQRRHVVGHEVVQRAVGRARRVQRGLVERVAREPVAEIILALSTDLEGDATAAYVRELLRGTLNPQRSTELIEEMRAVGLPL